MIIVDIKYDRAKTTTAKSIKAQHKNGAYTRHEIEYNIYKKK